MYLLKTAMKLGTGLFSGLCKLVAIWIERRARSK
jgi:hypothetical protein